MFVVYLRNLQVYQFWKPQTDKVVRLGVGSLYKRGPRALVIHRIMGSPLRMAQNKWLTGVVKTLISGVMGPYVWLVNVGQTW